MIAANQPLRGPGKLLTLEADGQIRHLRHTDLSSMFHQGDVVIANDAATLPASLHGTLEKSGGQIEIRLAGWVEAGNPTRFVAIAFGPGDHRIPTEERVLPPLFSKGDCLRLGPLTAVVEQLLDHPRLLILRFVDDRQTLFAGLALHGRPIQYAHVPKPLSLWDVWTHVAADPVAFEPPSAGFAIDWQTVAAWRRRGVDFVTLTHAAGISSTGDPALDARLPLDEPYFIPVRTAATINRAKSARRRIIAIGTTVVRALESAARADGQVHAGQGLAQGRIGRESQLWIADAILTGIHQPGESHFELLQAFANEAVLNQINAIAVDRGYRAHEFGDSMLIVRQLAIAPSSLSMTPKSTV